MTKSENIPNEDWVLDTGACVPMTKLKESFIEYTPFETPIPYQAANGGPLVAYGIGTIRILTEYGHLEIPNMLFVPHVSANLISVAKLRKLGYNVDFGPDLSFVVTDKNKNLITVSYPINDVYRIHSRSRVIYSVSSPDPLYLWHLRLGHAHYEMVSKISKIPIKTSTKISPCYPCLAGKQTKTRSTTPQRRASSILELIHTDLGGYYVKSLAGYRYFLLILDDFTRYIWIWFLKSKDKEACIKALREFKAYAENQHQRKIQRARSDNGTGEYANSEWREMVTESGIQHKPSPPNHQDRNGASERMIRTLKEMSTSILVQAGLPP